MGAILGIAYLLFLCVAVVVWVGPRAVAVMLLVSAGLYAAGRAIDSIRGDR